MRAKRGTRPMKETWAIASKKYREKNKKKISESRKIHYRNNIEEMRSRGKASKIKNKSKRVVYHRKRCLQKFNLTLEGYNLIFEQQNGCCAICGIHQSELKKSLSVDHDHNTGKIRGLLCNQCNFGIGCFKDSIELLTICTDYLVRSQ